MDKLIVTYALVRYCWHEGSDHLDCFWPFALRIMPTDRQPVDLPYIRDCLKTTFELDIPLYSVRTILKRAEKGHYVDRIPAKYPLMEKYMLTEKGVTYMQDIELEAQVERRMNALFVDMKQFVDKEIGYTVIEEDISTALLSFVQKNVEPLVEFFNPTAAREKTP